MLEENTRSLPWPAPINIGEWVYAWIDGRWRVGCCEAIYQPIRAFGVSYWHVVQTPDGPQATEDAQLALVPLGGIAKRRPTGCFRTPRRHGRKHSSHLVGLAAYPPGKEMADVTAVAERLASDPSCWVRENDLARQRYAARRIKPDSIQQGDHQ